MSGTWDTRKITEFVKGVLGCGCPDYVFEKIEVGRVAKGVLPLDATRINVGNTLLIYIVRPASGGELRDAIGKMVSVGRNDRDVHGFNRFRLVIAGDEVKLAPDAAAAKFSVETGGDEKMHFHCVTIESVRGL